MVKYLTVNACWPLVRSHSSKSHQSGCPWEVAKAMERERERMKKKQRQGEGRKKWWPSGMTQHPCRGLLNVPHASLTVTRRRMPGSDRCRTKSVVVYRYVSLSPALPSASFPMFVSTGDRPLPALVKQGAVWLIWMWWRRIKGRQVGL